MSEQQIPEVAENGQDDVEGFIKKTKSDTVYFRVFDGSICQTSKEAREGWEGPIETTNPQDKTPVYTYIDRYDQVVARIVDVNKYQKTFDNGGKVSGFELTLLAGPRRAIFRLKWIEPVLKRFLKVAENIDFNKPVRISVFSTIKNGKKGTAVSFQQGDGPVDQWNKVNEFWGRDNAELPQGVHDDMDDSWDYKEQNKFLGQKFAETVLPRIKAIAASHGIQQQAPQEAPVQEAAPIENVQQASLSEARANWDGQQAAAPAPAPIVTAPAPAPAVAAPMAVAAPPSPVVPIVVADDEEDIPF